MVPFILNKIDKQAGAELCQAQVKLGLAKLAVNRNKLRAYLLQVLGHIPFRSSSILFIRMSFHYENLEGMKFLLIFSRAL